MDRTIRLHSDEYCFPAIAAGLRLHRADVTTSPDAGLLSAEDEEHIAYALEAGRVIFTQDEDSLRLNTAGMDRSTRMCPPVRRRSIK
jgi:predicted nuclease of predicted toxin-antitoxin system